MYIRSHGSPTTSLDEILVKAVCRDREDKDECSSIVLSTTGLMEVIPEYTAWMRSLP
jgi:hypothetical protein